MFLVAILDTLAIVCGCVGGIAALRGTTWDNQKPGGVWRKLTVTGKLAAAALLLAFVCEAGSRWVYQYLLYADRIAAIDRENSVFWAARENICWVVVENPGARSTHDLARINDGRSPYEAVLAAQGHNHFAQLTIEQYGLDRTEAWISFLQKHLDERTLDAGTDCSSEFPERQQTAFVEKPSFWGLSVY